MNKKLFCNSNTLNINILFQLNIIKKVIFNMCRINHYFEYNNLLAVISD